MILYAIILFAIAAVLGAITLTKIVQDQNPPRPLVYSHGLFAAAALVLLIAHSLQDPDNAPMLSLTLFVIAALGGFVLFGRDLMGKPGPKALAFLHAGVAVTAFVLLLVAAWG